LLKGHGNAEGSDIEVRSGIAILTQLPLLHAIGGGGKPNPRIGSKEIP
jgi:hypothetical protein